VGLAVYSPIVPEVMKNYWRRRFLSDAGRIKESRRLVPEHAFSCYIARMIYFLIQSLRTAGARGSVVVKALCCKSEGRGFKSRCDGFFKLT
jgi:hypothetical protein